MTVSVDDVLKAAGAGASDADMAADVLAEATEHVSTYITRTLLDATVPVPAVLNDGAVLVCATDLFARRKAPFGQQLIPDGTGAMVSTRIGADPLAGVRPMLRAYCFPVGFAYPVDD